VAALEINPTEGHPRTPRDDGGSQQTPARDICTICSSHATEQAFVSRRGVVIRCSDCGTYRVKAEHTPEDHDSLFYSTIDESKYVSYFEPFRKGQYRQVLRTLDLPPNARHLDVGASYGWMVEVGLELGLDSYGLEPGAAKWKSAIAGRISRGSLEQYSRTAKKKFDVVTIWHVLEHLPDPLAAAEHLEQLLDDGGTLVVAVPTTDGRMFRLALLLERWLGTQRLLGELFYFHNANMHFYYYNAGGVRSLLERFGLRVSSVETMESFDWRTMHSRVVSPPIRIGLRLAGPAIAASGFTRGENLVVTARR
jgi:SAM-dependent methyltransferase